MAAEPLGPNAVGESTAARKAAVDPARPDPARSDRARLDPARLDPARLDPARLDPARPDEAAAAAQWVSALPPAPAVWCSGLRKRYGGRSAVEDVSLEVARGEVVGLLGPNGAGKTTVIKMLLGLVHPDAGEVLLLGRPSTDPASRAGVGYLPELFRYQPWLTAAEVLTLHVRLAGGPVPPAEQRDCLSLVGLADRARDRVGGFSKGMQQRLGLAVALVARPELVILDEPTSALDPLGRVDVRDIVLALKSKGVAVLLNSHLIGEVERVCDRVVILNRGRVATSGSLAQLLGRREVKLELSNVTAAALDRLAATGKVERVGNWFTVALPGQDGAGQDADEAVSDAGPGLVPDLVPDLVRDLVAMGARVHAVEPARISLEERLLGILRDDNKHESQADR